MLPARLLQPIDYGCIIGILGYVHATSAVRIVMSYEMQRKHMNFQLHGHTDYDCRNLKRDHIPLFWDSNESHGFLPLKGNIHIRRNEMPKNIQARAVREIHSDALRCLPHSFLSFPQGLSVSSGSKLDGPSNRCNGHPEVIASKAIASALSQWPEICGVVGYGCVA